MSLDELSNGGIVWVISDTHLNHRKVVEVGDRPEGFEEIIYANWRKLASPTDTVVHLGDVIFKKAGTLGAILETLPGRKILVRGNHDLNPAAWFEKKGFEAVYDELYVDDLLFTHEPFVPLPATVRLNLHGHWHKAEGEHYEMRRAPFEPFYTQDEHRYRLVEIDTGLALIPLSVTS
jgi:calcineurin-like phosphoesterase family protein